ncbi:hypothetical protein [Rhizobium leguminosarum]|uniref:hypothetical protein n=1 Tax=Rhizobium TaxID=379 RepID=UPI001FE00D4D|nr:hypothetical protein [Rhizobium leguminosarum]
MRVAAILFIAVCLFLAGATASRAYVSNSNLWLLATALVLYTLGNLSMIALMRASGLSLAISLSSVARCDRGIGQEARPDSGWGAKAT